jgi:pimeloyl-ACP methyl ester carboxylesterase
VSDLLPGVRSDTIQTDRLRMHYLESGPADGVPVVLVHGNLSTGRFYEHLMPGAPEGLRLIAPDMRGFGDSEFQPIDATSGLGDWALDIRTLLEALDIAAPPHLAGWSTGGAAIAAYAARRPVASLTLIDPVSPYGYGGVRDDGTPCFPDFAGSGGGTASPDFVERLRAGDRSTESAASPRNVMNGAYWAPSHREPPAREEILLTEILKTQIGDDGYPGDAAPSEHWPGVAPGTRGILNALSPKYCDWSSIVDLDPKPPVLWAHGAADVVVADGAVWEMGTLGRAGHVPGWPGEDVFPPQRMVSQIRAVLERYRDAGGRVRVEMFEGSGHFPAIDAAERFSALFFEFVASAR